MIGVQMYTITSSTIFKSFSLTFSTPKDIVLVNVHTPSISPLILL